MDAGRSNGRKLFFEDGSCLTGMHVKWKTSSPGMLEAREVMYELIGSTPETPEYFLRLTETEMLETVAAWMTTYTQHKQEQRNAERRLREQAT
jgi:hypothetical protein